MSVQPGERSSESLSTLFERVRASGFVDLAGTRLAATIPISERLLNALLAASLPQAAKLRQVSVHPQEGNRLTVRVKLPKVDFLPPVAITLLVEQQPEPPDLQLVLRVLTLPGVMSLVSAAFPLASMLPPGVRIERDRVFVDLKTLAERQGYGDVAATITSLRVRTDAGKLIVEVDARA